MERLTVPHRVIILVLIPRDSVPTGRFDFHQFVERAMNPCCHTKINEVVRQRMINPEKWPGDGTVPRTAIGIWLRRSSQCARLCAARKRNTQSNKGNKGSLP